MEHYKVISEMDGTLQCYYICETETLEMVLEPSRYLMHKTMSNKSPNTVRGMPIRWRLIWNILGSRTRRLTRSPQWNMRNRAAILSTSCIG